MSQDLDTEMSAARRVLGGARDKLDAALAAMPGAGRDAVMATPGLLSLLLHAVEAKREVDRLAALLVGDDG
ncbi:MAG TPA: hypothetical protein VN853_01175 [Polyangia bacterium]|jgi:hypothetical protein|nr:hypothetical protein [Polyangia bacterium]